MRFINMYLLGYVVLIIGVLLAMWKSGAMQHIAPVWIAIGAVVAIGLGIMLAVGAGKPSITREERCGGKMTAYGARMGLHCLSVGSRRGGGRRPNSRAATAANRHRPDLRPGARRRHGAADRRCDGLA